MRQIRIHVGYKTTDAPWGGANNFVRALRNELVRSGRYLLTDSMSVDCDILFMSQLSIGPGAQISFDRVRRVREGRATLTECVRRHKPARASRLVVRAVNLNRHKFRIGLRNFVYGRWIDRQVLRLLNFADFVVFQSAYQQNVFLTAGYTGTRSCIIHNGADPAFWVSAISAKPAPPVLRIASSTASPRASKRHDLIARLSEMPDVEVVHFGNWPANVDSRSVRRYGMVTREEMAAAYAQSDCFFHPAVKDPCPNAIFEAICSGLPVIYNPGPGSSAEIVGDNGFPLDENDLAATVRRARVLLPELRQSVIRTRDYYTIARATRQYRDVFDAMAVSIANDIRIGANELPDPASVRNAEARG